MNLNKHKQGLIRIGSLIHTLNAQIKAKSGYRGLQAHNQQTDK